MPCELGLKNTDEEGGNYEGKGISKIFGNILKRFEIDGFSRDDVDNKVPDTPLIYVSPGTDIVDKDIYPFAADFFRRDGYFGEITCGGIGDTDVCKGCKYLISTLKYE